MNSMKVAAIAAGSLVALGAATPAFADGLTPSSLNGGLQSLAADGLRSGAPLNTNALDTENKGSLVNAVSDTTDSLNKAQKGGSLLGGLPLGG